MRAEDLLEWQVKLPIALRLYSRATVLLKSFKRYNGRRVRIPRVFYVVRWVQELAREKDLPLFMCFIDLQKAYDSVDRSLL